MPPVGALSRQGRQNRCGEAEYARLPEESPESEDEADLDTHHGTVTDRATSAAAQAAEDAAGRLSRLLNGEDIGRQSESQQKDSQRPTLSDSKLSLDCQGSKAA